MLGKAKTPLSDIVTTSSVKSIIVGLGDRFPELTSKLEALLKYSFTSSDLLKIHQSGRADMKNWRDPSMDNIINEKKKKLTHDLWMNNMSTGFGKKEHPINKDTKHLHPRKVKLENVKWHKVMLPRLLIIVKNYNRCLVLMITWKIGLKLN